jgi:integrase
MNCTVSLIRLAKVSGKGWRKGAAIIGKTGRLKHEYMIVAGTEVHAPEGRYQLRTYNGIRPVYTNVSNDPAEAMVRYRAEQSKYRVRKEAKLAGLDIVVPEAAAARPTLQQMVTTFVLKHRNSPHRSDDSVQVYDRVTGTFLEHTEAKYINQITEDDILRWHAWMRRERKYSDRTCSGYYMSLRSFLAYCGLDLKKLIPAGTHKLLRQYTKRVVNTYTPEQVDALIKASTDDDRALLWDFAYKTGLRDSELQMVTRFDLHELDGENPTLHVKERDEYGRIKDAEERTVELHPSLVPRLRQWLKDNPKKVLLFGTCRDKPDTKMLPALKITARRAGLNCGRCKGCLGRNGCGEYTLHRFRRTYVTRMLRATQGDLRSVMTRSGHSDIASVMRYLEPAASIRTAVAAAF